jgi:hypothetical protein
MSAASRPLILASALSVLASTIAARSEDQPRDRDVLARAGAQVRTYETELPKLVARETYVQRETRLDGERQEPPRRLIAEFAWVAFPESSDVLGIRDVVEVDGRDVTTERERLQHLLHGHSTGSAAEARRLLAEGARYNLGDITRNFNLPTLVLFYLHPRAQSRFSWKRRPSSGAAVWEFEYSERDRPTMIRANDRPLFSRGRVSIEPDTGIIRRSELRLRLDDKRSYTLVTTFQNVDSLGLVLPATLQEWCETPSMHVFGEATYDNYRRFETDARLLP